MRTGDTEPVVHHLAGAGDGDVAEASRVVEEFIRIGEERAVGGAGLAISRFFAQGFRSEKAKRKSGGEIHI